MAESDCIAGKACSECGHFKLFQDFYASLRGKHGRASKCKTCVGKKSAARTARPDVKARLAELNAASYVKRRDKRRSESGWVDPSSLTHRACSGCGVSKLLSDYYRDRGRLRAICAECHKASAARWYTENRERCVRNASDWQRRNPEKVKSSRSDRWRRKKSDPEFRLKSVMRTAVGRSIRDRKERGSWRHLPYSLQDMKSHIERQFVRGMTWENYGEWHIDHIVPLSSFTFSSIDDPEFKRAWCLTNLRPLWARDNLSKHAKRTHLI